MITMLVGMNFSKDNIPKYLITGWSGKLSLLQ